MVSFRAKPRNLVETYRSTCSLFLPSPKLRRGCHAVTGEDCCLIIRTSILIRINIIIENQSSIRLALILRSIHLSSPLGKSKYKKQVERFVSTRFPGFARNDRSAENRHTSRNDTLFLSVMLSKRSASKHLAEALLEKRHYLALAA